MQEISILIVDDDKLLVEKLEKTMDWERLGIGTVLTALNIRQARRLLEEYPVQILLCDIDMPQGSGLELLEWIRDTKREAECIFLSSYANFAYAQMAMRLSSREYLLKPISNADLERALARIVKLVREKRKPVTEKERLPREKLWADLLLRRVPEKLWLENARANFMPGEEFQLVLVRILEEPDKQIGKQDIAIFDFTVRNVAGEYFSEKTGIALLRLETAAHIGDLEWMLVFAVQKPPVLPDDLPASGALPSGASGGPFSASGEHAGLVSGAAGSSENAGAEEEVCAFAALLRRTLDRKVGIYLGEAVPFEETGKSRACLEAMEERAVLDEDYLLKESSWNDAESAPVSAPWEIWRRQMTEKDGIPETRQRVREYIEKRRGAGGWSRKSLDEFLRRLTRLLYQYLDESGYEFTKIFDGQEFDAYEKAAHASMAGARDFADWIFEKLAANRKASECYTDVVAVLKEYIHSHLDGDLSRAELAKQVSFSEGYISKLFQKETGISLPNYIAEKRIARAREYLENSELPVSRIAACVGYNNFSYFSKTFRELTGYTPNEYRTKVNKNQHRN